MAGRGRGGAGRGVRGTPSRGGGGPARGGRGGPVSVGGGGLPSTGEHVTTVGVKRLAFGTAGRQVSVFTNHYEIDIPSGIIYHYDVAITPSEQTLPAKMNMELIRKLQEIVHPEVFTPRGVYDGRKNMFSMCHYPFENDTRTFSVSLGDSPPPDSPGPGPGKKGPKVYRIKLTKVAEINPEVLDRFLQGKQSQDNTVLTAITALNVVVRMEPTTHYPFNVRSFFTDREQKDIGAGIVLWRGYFQSVRPAIGKMLINIDISTGTMYKAGPLLDLCLGFFGRTDPNILAPSRGFPEKERLRLQRFLAGVRVTTPAQSQQQRRIPRVVKRLSTAAASSLTFTNREGQVISVAAYFQQAYNITIRFPQILCVEVGNGALYPIEVCNVLSGQIMRKQVPPEKTKDVLEFATKRPDERLNSIRNGLGVLAHGQSEYVRQFGIALREAGTAPLSINARVLNPPKLMYGKGSKQPSIVPRDGAWNMIDKKLYKPVIIERWVVVVYERPNRFRQDSADDMVRGLLEACQAVGITVLEKDPIIRWENAQGRISDQLRAAGSACNQKNKGFPKLIVAVLPEGATDIYTAIKHFGDVSAGVATQCLKAIKCGRAKQQYFANVCLKINVKLGGINTVPTADSTPALFDPHNPTIVMGADVIHPAAHAEGKPSFTSLVANVDSETAKYVADCRVQTSRQEMIDDLGDMAKHMLDLYMRYRKNVEKARIVSPKRIIFYRDGVSEGQFKQVLEHELPQLKDACAQLQINPTITVIVVGKRHHVRFFPKTQADADRSGNCRAGTVVDRDITHPLEMDFYLQSHAGLLGTSRPAHYNVLYDENKFTADALQALSFSLCHVYARSTRSVSIPAPVYYADIVCSRAKNHYDPQQQMNLTDTGTDDAPASQQLEVYKKNFKPLHANMSFVMYFS
ncbi:argonaute-like protein [Panus rudis PR-1116 ss-1]|nr:argonaute-like protein [Panus rudis PR-1116 ss-1]